MGYSFVVTFVILKVLDLVMGLRVSEEEELVGLDTSQHGERAYLLDGGAPYAGIPHRLVYSLAHREGELEQSMNKIEAIVRPERLDAVKEALAGAGFVGLNIVTVTGRGVQKGIVHAGRGGEEYRVDMLPKSKIELVVNDCGHGQGGQHDRRSRPHRLHR